ncbi:hypothetical protein Ciccas_009976, partial [Cichlidogyrus casuarinus]
APLVYVPDVVKAIEGQPLQVPCYFVANPMAYKIHLERTDSRQMPSANLDQNSSISFNNVSLAEAGDYRCVVENRIYDQRPLQGHANFKLVVQCKSWAKCPFIVRSIHLSASIIIKFRSSSTEKRKQTTTVVDKYTMYTIHAMQCIMQEWNH